MIQLLGGVGLRCRVLLRLLVLLGLFGLRLVGLVLLRLVLLDLGGLVVAVLAFGALVAGLGVTGLGVVGLGGVGLVGVGLRVGGLDGLVLGTGDGRLEGGDLLGERRRRRGLGGVDGVVGSLRIDVVGAGAGGGAALNTVPVWIDFTMLLVTATG